LVAGFDANDRVLRDLSVDSGILEFLREEFNKMLVDKAFQVYTFQEGKAYKRMRGLRGKVRCKASKHLIQGRCTIANAAQLLVGRG